SEVYALSLHDARPICRLLRTPDRDTALFVAALSFLGVLPPEEAARALRDRAAALEEHSAGLGAELQATVGRLPRLLLLEAEYERARIDAERAWVREVLEDLGSGRLDWSPERLAGRGRNAPPSPGKGAAPAGD